MMHSCAFVTFVMMNDHYVPGALVFAHALRAQKVQADILCLVTPDISKRALVSLSMLFDDVIPIDTIHIHHKNHRGRADRPFLFTRFQAFRLGLDGDLGKGYEKIVVCDADILPIKHYDDLWSVEAPAGILNESKYHCLVSYDGTYIQTAQDEHPDQWHWHGIYGDYPHGSLIDSIITDRVITDHQNMGINACLCRIDPKMDDYMDILSDMNNPTIMDRVSSYPWPEMQYLTEKFSGRWHNVDIRYASFNGYPKLDVLNGTHFAGIKPWHIHHRSVKHFSKYDDYQLFMKTFIEMMQTYPKLLDNSSLKRIQEMFVMWLNSTSIKI